MSDPRLEHTTPDANRPNEEKTPPETPQAGSSEKSGLTSGTPTLDYQGSDSTSGAEDHDLPAFPGYEILERLGRGGMGVVYKARQVRLNRIVALKVLRMDFPGEASDRRRFFAEAEAIAQLHHPHVVQIHEVGEHQGRPFLVLELVEGGSLEEQLRDSPLEPLHAAELVENLARAIQAAHQRGIIHRDLKPSNVLLSVEGLPKVSDFGLAKKLEAPSGPTVTGAILGTPSYMAPEQARSQKQEIGPKTDVYGLGAILYECLTGRPPFQAASLLETLEQVCTQNPEPPSQGRPVPPALEAICLKCLRKAPVDRYASAEALAEDLRRFQAGKPTEARVPGSAGRVLRWCWRHALVLVFLLGVGFCLVGPPLIGWLKVLFDLLLGVNHVLVGWFAVVLILFWRLPAYRALIAGVLAGTLLLPEVTPGFQYRGPEPQVVAGLPLTKVNVVSLSALLGVVLFDARHLFSFRPRWFDLPALAWCLCPFLSDWAAGVSWGQSVAAFRDQTVMWGIPYLLARVYLTEANQLRDLALGFVLGGLFYVPLCFSELRFFPYLHDRLYGFFPGARKEVFHSGRYTPVVFLSNGKAVGMFMLSAMLMGVCLWRPGSFTRLRLSATGLGIAFGWVVIFFGLIAMGITAAFNPLALFVPGILILLGLYQMRRLKWPALLLFLMALAPLYMGLRLADSLADNRAADRIVGALPEGASSVEVRLSRENPILNRVSHNRLLLGLGDLEVGGDEQTQAKYSLGMDSQWVVTVGRYGLFGLASLTLLLLLPPARLFWHFPRRLVSHPDFGPTLGAAVVLILCSIHVLSDVLHNPALFMLLAGGLAGWSPKGPSGGGADATVPG